MALHCGLPNVHSTLVTDASMPALHKHGIPWLFKANQAQAVHFAFAFASHAALVFFDVHRIVLALNVERLFVLGRVKRMGLGVFKLLLASHKGSLGTDQAVLVPKKIIFGLLGLFVWA